MARKLTIDGFNKIYGEKYEYCNGAERTYRVFSDWAICGCANMQEEAEQLTRESRKILLHHIVCSRGVQTRSDERICTAIINSL